MIKTFFLFLLMAFPAATFAQPSDSAAAAENKFNNMSKKLGGVLDKKADPANKPYGVFAAENYKLGDRLDLRDMQGKPAKVMIGPVSADKKLIISKQNFFLKIPQSRWNYKFEISESGLGLSVNIIPQKADIQAKDHSVYFSLIPVSYEGGAVKAVGLTYSVEATKHDEPNVKSWGEAITIAKENKE